MTATEEFMLWSTLTINIFQTISRSLSEYYEKKGVLPEEYYGFWLGHSNVIMVFAVCRLQKPGKG